MNPVLKPIPMSHKFSELDLDSLKIIYDEEVHSLKQRILNGESWEALQEQRDQLLQLSEAMYEKVQSLRKGGSENSLLQ